MLSPFVFLCRLLCRHCDWCKPKHPAVALRFLFGPVNDIMAKAILHTDDNTVSATLAFTDKKGNATSPAAPPTWSLSADGIVSMTVAGDGLSAAFAPMAPGDVTVNVVAEGDATPGVDTLHISGDISVLPAEAASAELSFGPVS